MSNAADPKPELYSAEDIRDAYNQHAFEDDWGVPSMYFEGLIAALRGEYDQS